MAEKMQHIAGFSFLTENEYIVKQTRDEFYNDVHLSDGDFEGIICIPKDKTHNLLFAAKLKNDTGAIVEIHETPSWFQLLYQQAIEGLIKRSRLPKLFN